MQAFQSDLEIGAKVREEERRPVLEKPQVGELPLEHVPDEDPGGQGECTSINIYARLCALLRRCLSMAKTFFHVFNL